MFLWCALQMLNPLKMKETVKQSKYNASAIPSSSCCGVAIASSSLTCFGILIHGFLSHYNVTRPSSSPSINSLILARIIVRISRNVSTSTPKKRDSEHKTSQKKSQDWTDAIPLVSSPSWTGLGNLITSYWSSIVAHQLCRYTLLTLTGIKQNVIYTNTFSSRKKS